MSTEKPLRQLSSCGRTSVQALRFTSAIAILRLIHGRADEPSSGPKRHLPALLGNHQSDARSIDTRAVVYEGCPGVLQADGGVLQRRGRRSRGLQRRVRRVTPAGGGPPRGTPPSRATAPARRGGPPRAAAPRGSPFRMLSVVVLLLVLLVVALT